MQKKLLSLLLSCWLFHAAAPPSHAEVLFHDNFDASPDWQSAESKTPAVRAIWPNTWAGRPGGPTQPPPQRWTSYRAAIPKRDGHAKTFVLGPEGARNPGGKGITYNIEAISYGTWVGGGLDLYLGDTGHREMFVRFYLKYDPATFHWGTAAPNFGLQKLARISRLKIPPSTSFSVQEWDTPENGGYQMPTFFPDLMNNPVYNAPSAIPPKYGVHFNYSHRYDPTYFVSDGNSGVNVWSVPWPSAGAAIANGSWFESDGRWHCYEFRVKMNSAPGVADGEWEAWIDGGGDPARHLLKTGIPWVSAGGSVNPGWNWVTVLDNSTIQPDAPYADSVMKIFMDDFAVGTHYSGPPASPADVSARGLDERSIVVTFRPGSNGATFQTTGYRVYYGTNRDRLDSFVTAPASASEIAIPGLAPATRYYLAVTAFNRNADEANDNESARVPTSAVTRDEIPPDLTKLPIPELTRTKSLTLSGTAVDAGGIASVTVRVGAAAAVPATVSGETWECTIPALTEGGNDIVVLATDLSGNETVLTDSILLDTVPPTLSIAPIAAPTISTSLELTGTVFDLVGVSSVQVQVGGEEKAADLQGGNWRFLLGDLSPGVTTVSVTARDRAGNVSASTSATSIPVIVLRAGDLSGDREVGVDDAQLAMQMGVGLKLADPLQLQRGDLAPMRSGVPAPDGVIDTGDAVLILGLVTGLLKF